MGLHYQSLCITSKTATLTADDDANKYNFEFNGILLVVVESLNEVTLGTNDLNFGMHSEVVYS